MDNNIKFCSKCEENKSKNQFGNDKKNKDGLRKYCKLCNNMQAKKYYVENVDKIKIKAVKYREENKYERQKYYEENREKELATNKIYYKKNKSEIYERKKEQRKENIKNLLEYRKKYHKKRMKSDKLYSLNHAIRGSIRQSFKVKNINKCKTSEVILGCSFDKFKLYLESKFESWMNWENRGLYNGTLNYGWDIDHIIPLSSAKTEEELIQLNHYTNLQPLCSKVNRDIKKDKIDYGKY